MTRRTDKVDFAHILKNGEPIGFLRNERGSNGPPKDDLSDQLSDHRKQL